jgi:hypothetical protein
MNDSFMLAIVSQWDNYVKLHFMQDGAPPDFVSPIRAQLDHHLPGWWTGQLRINRMASAKT